MKFGGIMRIIQGVHVDGRDKRKRYRKVPERLELLKMKTGDEAIVATTEGFSHIVITKVINSEDGTVHWPGGQLQVTQEVMTTVNQTIDQKFINRKEKEK